MEERQLNFNQPLLSVRRVPSVSALPEVNYRKTHNSKPTLPPLPYYKSDLKSGPVSNPGLVPFQWEQMPGRPKHENLEPKHSIRLPAVAPKLPPGRIANYKQKPIDKPSKDSPSSREHSEQEISSSEDENATFVDACGTLSQTESFYNCSVSGVSGLDNPSMGGSRNFSDPQTLDFMMGRFLPAAKSMAAETPHYASRKNSAPREESKTRVIKWKQPSPQYDLPSNLHGSEEYDQEVEDEDEYDGMEDMSAKLCGLLPKFCLLNPLPGVRDHRQAMSSVRSVRTKPAFVESSRKNEKKDGANGHVGDMKRGTHKSVAENQPSISENINSWSVAPLKDGSPQLWFDTEKRFPDLLPESRDFRANILDFQTLMSLQDAQETTSPPNPTVEKTLYIDHDQTEQSRNSISSSSESRGRNPSVDSLQDIKSNSGNDKQINHPKSPNTSELSFQDVGEDFQRDHNFNIDAKEGIQESSMLGLGPLLLPKSPSESWLARTLHYMPSKNPCLKPYLGNLTFRSSPMDPKRERVLRTSNLQYMVFRPARELGPILEN